MKNLPKLENEESFKRIEIPHKIKVRNISTSPDAGQGFMNKEVWFRNPRNIDMYTFHRRTMTNNF